MQKHYAYGLTYALNAAEQLVDIEKVPVGNKCACFCPASFIHTSLSPVLPAVMEIGNSKRLQPPHPQESDRFHIRRKPGDAVKVGRGEPSGSFVLFESQCPGCDGA